MGFTTKKRRLFRDQPLAEDASDIERRIYNSVDDNVGSDPKSVIESGVSVAERYEDELRTDGMLHPHPGQSSLGRWLGVMIMVAIMSIGLIKIAVGIDRDRPVGFLIAMTIGAGVAACILGARKYRTSAGEQVFQGLKSRHSALEDSVKSGLDVGAPEVALAVGLFGLAAVHEASALSPLYDTLKSERLLNTGGTYGGGCGGGCGGGGCGGGCGGCGGCGG